MIALLHPYILDYREDFFKGINECLPIDIYCYEPPQEITKQNHNKSRVKVNYISSISVKGIVFYNPFTFLKRRYDTLVLMLSIGHITTWLLLFTKPLHRKKIILWGHGISVKRFIKEEKWPNIFLRWMIAKADVVWFYTKHELALWQREIPSLNAVSLNNTLSNIDVYSIESSEQSIVKLKSKYKIQHDRIVIYCARFNTLERRIDLLESVIDKTDTSIGFIIIGDGIYKPDFSKYSNVYDFGGVYDRKIKKDLFKLSDIYFQPGWVGLSIIEAMAYAKPVFTFKRTTEILQCVEYANIIDGYNGILFDNVDDVVSKIASIKESKIKELGFNALSFVKDNLSMDNMINTAVCSINPSISPTKNNKSRKKRVLALWAPLADYSVASLKHLCSNYNVELLLVYQPSEENAPYKELGLDFCKKNICWNNSLEAEISNVCLDFNPDVVIMSSWNYKEYMKIAKMCKNQSSYIVSTFDGQWMGTLKQYLGIIVSPFYLKPVIDNFFVAGDRQATFARKLGYKNPFLGYYSANTIDANYHFDKPRVDRFIFVGRLVKAKNITTLISAYQQYRNSVENPWDLLICGKGPLEYLCKDIPGVKLMDFVQPKELRGLMLTSRCLLLLSVFEPWALVIHEAALTGLAIISSYQAGASTFFVRDGLNGFVINPETDSVAKSMRKISSLGSEQLSLMEEASRTLGNLWTTEKWATYVYDNICSREI